MWRPDSAKPVQFEAGSPETAPEAVPLPSPISGTEDSPAASQESDFVQLVAKFAAHGGGKIPAELSGELALDIVLNEIVEQACLATGANGAAIALHAATRWFVVPAAEAPLRSWERGWT
jgi:hypothetical protein